MTPYANTRTEALASALADHNDRIGTALDHSAVLGLLPTEMLQDAESSIGLAADYYLAIRGRFDR